MLKKFLFGLLGIAAVNTGVIGATAISSWADDSKITKGYYTMDAMGCMLLRECTKDVQRVESIATIADAHPDSDFDFIADEFSRMLTALENVGVNVFLADEKYFPVGHRGVYHTVGNNFF